jgi:hypothetical protein
LLLAKGTRTIRNGGLFDVAVDASSFVAELSVGQHPETDMMLPLHISGLQSRWSVGMWQHTGYGESSHKQTSVILIAAVQQQSQQHAVHTNVDWGCL